MDGATCALLFEKAGGRRENVHFVHAGQLGQFVREQLASVPGFIVFADVGGISDEEANVLEKRGDCVLLDHHKTSMNVAERSWCYVDSSGNGGSACGSELLRRYLASFERSLDDEPTRALVAAVDDHDRWLKKNSLGEELALLFSFFGTTEFIERFIRIEERMRNTDGGMLYYQERDVLRVLRRKLVERIAIAAKKTIVRDVEVDGRKYRVGYVLSSLQSVSEGLERVLDRHPEAQVAAQVNFDSGVVSLRSRSGGPDVAEFARAFGGGGHRGAAGHQIPRSLIELIVEEVHGGR